jgi:hypothetical protein
MRITEHTATCFEATVDGGRIMLDFRADASSPSPQYMPLARPAAADGVDTWRAVERHSHWLVDGEMRIEVPPVEGIDLGGADALLISDTGSFLTLPFLTEYSGFQGTVLATAAALSFGRLAMLELVALCEAVRELPLDAASAADGAAAACVDAPSGAPPPAIAVELWDLVSRSKLPYSRADVEQSLARVHGLSYGERAPISLRGADAGGSTLHATPLPSGAAIGACNWVIEGPSEKLLYVSASDPEGQVLATLPLTTTAPALRDADALLLCNVRPLPRRAPLQAGADGGGPAAGRAAAAGSVAPAAAIAHACRLVCEARAQGGHVLLPCSPWGGTLALLEHLLHSLHLTGLSHAPVHLISPVASACLSQAGMQVEWVDEERRTRTLAPPAPGRPQLTDPFPFDEHILQGRLVVASSLADLEAPLPAAGAIVLATHPSLRLGDAPNLLHCWRDDPRSLLLLTTLQGGADAEAAMALLLAPFEPVRCRVQRCILDARLEPSVAAAVVEQLAPRRLVVPSTSPMNSDDGHRAMSGSAAMGDAVNSADAADDDATHAATERLLEAADATGDGLLGRRCPASRLVRGKSCRMVSRRTHQLAFMPHSAAVGVQLRTVTPTIKAARLSGVLRTERSGHLALLPDAHASAATNTCDGSGISRRDGNVGDSSAGAAESSILLGTPKGERLVAALIRRGVEANVRQSADEADCTLVELVGGSEGAGRGARIELRSGGSESMLVATSLEALALLREVMMESLVEL